MIGDAGDIAARLRSLLPPRWFADSAPVLDGLLAGAADMAATAHGQIDYARTQTRIATATGPWLDLIALDFFGTRLQRLGAEADDAFRARVVAAMFLPRATRAATFSAVQALGFGPPMLFEPSRPDDTGAWNVALGYGVGGGWGSLAMPFQVLVTLPPSVETGSAYGALTDVLPAGTIAWTRPAVSGLAF